MRLPPAVLPLFFLAVLAAMRPCPASAQIAAHTPPDASPGWTKGIQPISAESYWNAVECGKQGADKSACVFYDADLCRNDDFTLALYTPYKQVAYTVWMAVRKKQPAPTPSYADAQRQRVIIGVTPVRGSKNPISSVVIKRGGKTVAPVTQLLDAGGGSFTFDFAPFAPTAGITLELIGKAKTHSCTVSQAALARFR
jgi:hypothetical protein